MGKIVRLTESELKNIIIESVKNIMTESLLKEYGDTDKGQEMLGKAAGRAQKRAQKIGRSNDYDAYCDMMGRADKIGNYARDQRIKNNGKPDDKTGAFTKGVKDGKQIEEAVKRALLEFNSVLSYSNRTSSESVKGTCEITANDIMQEVPKEIKETGNPLYTEIQEVVQENFGDWPIELTAYGTVYSEEATGGGWMEDFEIDENDVNSILDEINAFEASQDAKDCIKQAITNCVNNLDEYCCEWY